MRILFTALALTLAQAQQIFVLVPEDELQNLTGPVDIAGKVALGMQTGA